MKIYKYTLKFAEYSSHVTILGHYLNEEGKEKATSILHSGELRHSDKEEIVNFMQGICNFLNSQIQ